MPEERFEKIFQPYFGLVLANLHPTRLLPIRRTYIERPAVRNTKIDSFQP